MNTQTSLQMVDLRNQYLHIKDEVDAAIQSVIDSTAFIKGKDVGEFEKALSAYLGVKHVISCANGTDAIQMALMALGLNPGDEVITPSFTFVATAEVIALLGLRPVFVDVTPDTFTLDISDLTRKISSKTKAIIPVHLFGQCADMDSILAIAKEKNIAVIEDTAQAIGTKYTLSSGQTVSAGCLGDIGTTSFFPSKNLGCYGDGGAIFTNNDALAETLRSISNHGMKVRYHYDLIGCNSRLDTIQAAVLNVKLKRLDQYNAARQAAASYYDKHFSECKHLIVPKRNPSSSHTFHQYTLLMNSDDNQKMTKFLNENGVPSMIYYPRPLHVSAAYTCFGYKEGDLPVTEQLCQRVFSLPMHTELTKEQQDLIIDTVLKYYK